MLQVTTPLQAIIRIILRAGITIDGKYTKTILMTDSVTNTMMKKVNIALCRWLVTQGV